MKLFVLVHALVQATDSDEGSGTSITHACVGDETIQSSRSKQNCDAMYIGPYLVMCYS